MSTSKKLAMVLLSLWPVLMVGQNLPAREEKPTTKLYRLHYAQASHVADVLGPSFYVRGDNSMRVVLVQGTQEKLEQADKLIQELDQPGSGVQQRDVETTMYVITASDNALGAGVVPPTMAPVIKQLQGVFPYSNYQVLETMLVRSREGQQAITQGILRKGAKGPTPETYELRFQPSVDSAQRIVHLDEFRFAAEFGGYGRANFTTNLDLREGQKVVVGKANIDDGSSAMFVVVTARISGESEK